MEEDYIFVSHVKEKDYRPTDIVLIKEFLIKNLLKHLLLKWQNNRSKHL